MTGAQETVASRETTVGNRNTWKRGVFMLFFVIAFGIAQVVLNLMALVQFLSLLFTGARNDVAADFGAALGKWMDQVAAFQACTTEEKPFPFTAWPQPRA